MLCLMTFVSTEHAFSDRYFCELNPFMCLKPRPHTLPVRSSKPSSQAQPEKSLSFWLFLKFFLFSSLITVKKWGNPTFLSADNEILVFVRHGFAVMVEMAPRLSNSNFFSKFDRKVEQTFSFLHSIQKYSSLSPSHTRQNKI